MNYTRFIIIFIILILVKNTNSFLDKDKVITAINCGYSYYYRDNNGIVFRPVIFKL